MLYEKNGSNFESLVPNKEFFINPNGREDPHSELKSTIDIFRDPKKIASQCLFPARFQLLKEHFKLLNPVDCDDIGSWVFWSNPIEVNLVFASQYLSNPASFFGHTFLHFSSSKLPRNLELTIGYSAQVPDGLGFFKYAYHGITGGFVGKFSEVPMIRKIHEYNNIENRDLWFYPIKLTQKESLLLMKHLFELTRLARFDYGFFKDNCSYMLLKTIEAIKPEVTLSKNYPIYASPAETLIKTNDKGLLKPPKLLHSLRKQEISNFKKLSSEEKSLYKKTISTIESQEISKYILDKENIVSPHFFDALLDRLDIIRHQHKGKLPEELNNFKNTILVKRSKFRSSPDLEKSKKQKLNRPDISDAPHFGHKPRSIGMGYRNRSSENIAVLDLKPAIHSLMDLDTGYIRYSKVEVLHLEAEYPFRLRSGPLNINKLSLLSMANMIPFNSLHPQFSWAFDLAYKRDEVSNCYDCRKLSFDTSFGVGFSFKENKNLYFLSHLIPETGQFKNHGRVLAGVGSLLIYPFGNSLKFLIDYKNLWKVASYNSKKAYNEFNLKLALYPNQNLRLLFGTRLLNSRKKNNLLSENSKEYSFTINNYF
jgi:hypothetical protein